MRLNGIDCIVVGMATNEMHTVDEYVVIPDLMQTARLCQSLMSVNQ
jgi:acetylornithine deacetylase/succinyl-diaminopimelate desuccinylase-like protein